MLPGLLILLGVALAGLLLPVLIAVRAERQAPGSPVRLQADWGFFAGAAGVQVCLHGDRGWYLYPAVLGRRLPFPRVRLGAQKAAGPEEAPVARAAPVPREEAPGRAGAAGLLKRAAALEKLAAQFAPPAVRLLAGLGKSIRLRHLRLDGRFGLADPASTGQVFGYLQGVRALLPERLGLELRPNFVSQGVDGRFYLAVHFYLGYALLLGGLFAARLGWRLLVVERFFGKNAAPARR